jgi:asparaginyl-tRNA synthetase
MISTQKNRIKNPRYMEILHKDIRNALSVQHVILLESRKILDDLGFVEILAPVIGPASDPGIRGAKRASFNYYGEQYRIMSSMILYKQALVRTFDNVYAFAPNVRLEPLANTNSDRHLCEFYQIDLEMKDKTIEDVMKITEIFLEQLLYKVDLLCKNILDEYNRNLLIPSIPFPKIPYSKIVEIADAEGFPMLYGDEIPWELEVELSKHACKPFWIVDYPVGSRGFYYKVNPDDPSLLFSMDLIYPQGFGEASSGGERETDVRRIRYLLQKTEENIDEYSWYLEMLKTDGQKSSGLGIGVERLTRFVLGFDSIDKCTAFPKKPGVYSI